jgi:hypothetical protein
MPSISTGTHQTVFVWLKMYTPVSPPGEASMSHQLFYHLRSVSQSLGFHTYELGLSPEEQNGISDACPTNVKYQE